MSGKGIDLSGLDQFNSASFLEGIDMEAASNGKPLLIPLDQISPDPEQPRQEINAERLKELTASIRERGVKSPISVKPKNAAGIYYINHGERRFHASRKAGLTEIPAFIDDDHTSYDQVVENIQRENLTPLEIAHFIERRIEAGDKKRDIAKILGKPASYISDHAVFFEFPDFIRELYDSGRCRSIQALALLFRGYKEFPGMVAGFCTGNREMTTSEVRDFIAELKEKGLEAKGLTPTQPEKQAQGDTIPPQTKSSPSAPQAAPPSPGQGSSGSTTEIPAPSTPKPPGAVSLDLREEGLFLKQLDHLLAPLEHYLAGITDPDSRQAAARRLNELAKRFGG